MKLEDLKIEISIELELMEATVQELLTLERDVTGKEPTVREKVAAAAFMAQFYNGVENILKRIGRFHSVPLPTGDTWHIDLFKRFCSPALVLAWRSSPCQGTYGVGDRPLRPPAARLHGFPLWD